MIFSELYGAYYNTVARILRQAVTAPVTPEQLRQIVQEYAFAESLLTIEPALTAGRWQLLLPDGTTPLRHAPTLPLTLLQRRWIKAIAMDPRIRLFTDEEPDDPDIEPLFTPEDWRVYDKYADGDPYTDAGYIERFRIILRAIETETPLLLCFTNRSGRDTDVVVLPQYLEYSEKDDKFRLVGAGKHSGRMINLARVTHCEPFDRPFTGRPYEPQTTTVTFEVKNERNALNRVLLHFAHFEKEAAQLDNGLYRVTVRYDVKDEPEMVIRLLSFGPVLRVTEPERFVTLIIRRLKKQMRCGLLQEEKNS